MIQNTAILFTTVSPFRPFDDKNKMQGITGEESIV